MRREATSNEPRKRGWKRGLLLIVAIVLVVAFYPAWLGYQIWEQSRRDEPHTADAIVVLGAAQYDGQPSNVFQARLDHAAYLFHEGFSDTIIVTGGKAQGDRFSEAEAGAKYLVDESVPNSALLREDRGSTTLESLEAVARIAEDNAIESVLLVSDPMHSERIKRIARDLGFDEAYVSWASYVQLNRSRSTKFKELVREIGSLLSYELLGH